MSLFKTSATTSKDCQIVMFGSTITGLATKRSDLDIMLKLPATNYRGPESTLQTVANALRGEGSQTIINVITDCKVPIVRGCDRETGIYWDLSMYRESTLKVAHLFKNYVDLDERVAMLIIAIKTWAKKNGICNAHEGTLSCYSWSLLMLHYLQCCSPPVVPCLQQRYPDLFGAFAQLTEPEQLEANVEYTSSNQNSVDDLFKGFFFYYTQIFNYRYDVVSIRCGRCLQKSDVLSRPPRAQWKFYCIEEPYEQFNTARSMFKDTPFIRVYQRLQDTSNRLRNADVRTVLSTDI